MINPAPEQVANDSSIGSIQETWGSTMIQLHNCTVFSMINPRASNGGHLGRHQLTVNWPIRHFQSIHLQIGHSKIYNSAQAPKPLRFTLRTAEIAPCGTARSAGVARTGAAGAAAHGNAMDVGTSGWAL